MYRAARNQSRHSNDLAGFLTRVRKYSRLFQTGLPIWVSCSAGICDVFAPFFCLSFATEIRPFVRFI